jgi:hypothetical protein
MPVLKVSRCGVRGGTISSSATIRLRPGVFALGAPRATRRHRRPSHRTVPRPVISGFGDLLVPGHLANSRQPEAGLLDLGVIGAPAYLRRATDLSMRFRQWHMCRVTRK